MEKSIKDILRSFIYINPINEIIVRYAMEYKVVINVCYGSYCLSQKAMDYLMEKYGDYFREKHRREVEEYEERSRGWPKRHRLKIDHKIIDENWGDHCRHDPKLIEVVEKLGKKASGKYSDLRIVVLEYGSKYRINEYDGKEDIEEPNDRYWQDASDVL